MNPVIHPAEALDEIRVSRCMALTGSGHLRFYRFGKSHLWRKGMVAVGPARFCLSGNGVLLIAKAKPALRIEEGGRIRRMAEGSRHE